VPEEKPVDHVAVVRELMEKAATLIDEAVDLYQSSDSLRVPKDDFAEAEDLVSAALKRWRHTPPRGIRGKKKGASGPADPTTIADPSAAPR
jgi:hypothetical protein